MFSENYIKIYIHEDGSFDEKCMRTIEEIFPFIEILKIKNVNRKLEKLIYNRDIINNRLKLLRSFKFHLRLIDFPWLSKRSRILSLDSDCYFLKNPSDLFSAIMDGNGYIHAQAKYYSHGNAEKILKELNFSNRHDLKKSAIPGAYLIVYPSSFYKKKVDLVNKFVNYLNVKGAGWCDEQGFFDITLKNNFKEIALSPQKYISTGWPYKIKLDDYDFKKNTKGIEVIHTASNKEFSNQIKLKILKLLQRIIQ